MAIKDFTNCSDRWVVFNDYVLIPFEIYTESCGVRNIKKLVYTANNQAQCSFAYRKRGFRLGISQQASGYLEMLEALFEKISWALQSEKKGGSKS